MFRAPNEKVPRAKPTTSSMVPVGIPFKGLNSAAPYSSMDPNEAISLNNVIIEAYGARTRKGYTEWAVGLPTEDPVHSILNYYPSTYDTQAQTWVGDNGLRYRDINQIGTATPLSALGPGPGQIFAAQGTSIYNVTAGGAGPWTPEVGVTGVSPFWNGLNYQNVAGSFLLAANEKGGYAIYDGTAWTMPSAGTNPEQISGVDPAKICWVVAWKERIWFFVVNSTVAYYLPPGQITGKATAFDFGTAMDHGGTLSFLGGWTLDGGIGVDDYLVAVGSQGDVVIYKGTDPNDISAFALHGVWYAGPLPTGLRAVEGSGGDIHILTQMGVIPVSGLMKPSNIGAQAKDRITAPIDPLVAALMRDYSTVEGWQLTTIAKEEIILIRLPPLTGTYLENTFLAFKTTTKTWSVLSKLPYAHSINAGSLCYAGSMDGRVLRAFEGQLDDMKLNVPNKGIGIPCRVTPAYNPLGKPGINKHLKMVRPYFLTSAEPKLTITVLTNYSGPRAVFTPTVINPNDEDAWDSGVWDSARWGTNLRPLNNWYGCAGWGHAITVQLDYVAGGDTILTSMDYWMGSGGVM